MREGGGGGGAGIGKWRRGEEEDKLSCMLIIPSFDKPSQLYELFLRQGLSVRTTIISVDEELRTLCLQIKCIHVIYLRFDIVLTTDAPMARDVETLTHVMRTLLGPSIWELEPHIAPLPFDEEVSTL